MLILYSISIFCGAALLFLVQPLFARLVLPLLGGSPAVWNTALVFYQTALLAGYAWTHFSIQWLGAKRQAAVHLAVLVLALFFLPISLPHGWTPPATSSPVGWLLLLLLFAVGAPFFAVSTTSPALQRWFAATGHPAAKDPYFLYAASNAGSLLALGAYPFLLEPNMRLAAQSNLWTWGFRLLIVLSAACAFGLWKSAPAAPTEASADTAPGVTLSTEPITSARRLRWVVLAAVPSSLMVGATTYLSNEIAAIPLMWIVPLTLYLLSFIIVFSRRGDAVVPTFARVFAILVLPLLVALAVRAVQPMGLLIPLHLVVLLIAAVMCHGALAHDRPAPARLTEFYLLMSLGGALGGAFNALVAPFVFKSVAEYPIALAGACLLIPARLIGAPERDWKKEAPRDILTGAGMALATIGMVWWIQLNGQAALNLVHWVKFFTRMDTSAADLALMFGPAVVIGFASSRRPLRFALIAGGIALAGNWYHIGQESRILRSERSFFGVNRVTLSPSGRFRQLVHGNTLHGQQSVDPKWQNESLSYYYHTGPIGQVFQKLGPRFHNVGIVGLGVGSLAPYGHAGQNWTYYEIDPVVEAIAREDFTFLRNARANVQVVLGDARLRLGDAPDGAYDLLVLDAYSSDAIPVHLMTSEAIQLYLRKLSPHGVLAFHISNRHMNLAPVVTNLAREHSLVARICIDFPGWDDRKNIKRTEKISEEWDRVGKSASQWTVLAHREADLGSIIGDKHWELPRGSSQPPWTDDYSSILPVLTWK